ncbi:EAL domain-containing protein [Desulfosporosinus shakirovi]|uniref:EAL domain-containing protein n=1 Tax=Desulfosporosinus shakirovi TaxID=2885154 RepID=UPI001E4443C2|nr:EAL domain-containing protein [Desulfosporosinus sp. SRJS8]MCB8818619.1 EAL domain-containing protein [Desulfosporosinus sp. SRJS8]
MNEPYHQILEGIIPTAIALQPIVNLQNSSIIGYEALARWHNFSPEFIFALAEKHHDVDSLESLVVKEIQRIRDLVPGLLFINVHPAVTNPKLWSIFGQRKVVLEITEAQSINFRGAYRLREMGFPLALDDLGTGHSTFEALLQLQPEFLKLDKVLTQATNFKDRNNLFAAMVDYAWRSGSQVIAEGIETKEQLQAAKKTGCHFGQGYLLGKPRLYPLR